MPDKKLPTGIQDWLSMRMAEAHLSADEIKEFTEWLICRPSLPDLDRTDSKSKPLTAGELKQFADWIKIRMHEAPVTTDENKQFNHWLLNKLSDNVTVADCTLEEVRKQLEE